MPTAALDAAPVMALVTSQMRPDTPPLDCAERLQQPDDIQGSENH
jgi:hypothetical protein